MRVPAEPAVITDLPILPRPSARRLPGGEVVALSADQIAVWVSITVPQLAAPPDDALPFPAVLDTGFTGSFQMPVEQLHRWASRSGTFRPRPRRDVPPRMIDGQPVSAFDIDVWLYPNIPGTTTIDPSESPVRLGLIAGAHFTLEKYSIHRRLPLIGMLALRWNRVRIDLDAGAGRVSVLTP